MNSATLPFHLTNPADFAGEVSIAPWLRATPQQRRYRGVVVSVLLHGAVVLLAWNLATGSTKPAPESPVIELIRVAPPRQLAPPPPPKAVVQPKPVALTAPRPAVAATPQPKTVAAPAAAAETYASPETPAPATPIGPVTPVASAPAPAPVAVAAKPAAPKVISTEGIPTDYVNQVYARINRNTDYPQAAKLRRQQGKVAYVLTLDPQGALLKVDITGSGLEALDDAARQAIERAAPFPRLPDLGGSSYLLAGNIVFKLN